MILGQNLGEFHSGLRAYSKEVIESVSFMSYSDDFVFDSQFLVQSIQKGFRLGDIPVPVRYNENASSISLVRSIQYGVATLGVLTFFILNKFKIYKAKFLR